MSTATEELKTTRPTADRPPLRVADDANVPEGESYVLTSAETAECCCPDACERDHANE